MQCTMNRANVCTTSVMGVDETCDVGSLVVTVWVYQVLRTELLHRNKITRLYMHRSEQLQPFGSRIVLYAILYYTVYVYVYCMNNLVLLQLPSVIYSTKQQHTQSHPIHVDDTHQTRMIHIRQAHTNKH